MNEKNQNFFNQHSLRRVSFQKCAEPIRVAFYARVSTGHEAQLSAFENQLTWYEDELNRHPNWKKVKVYTDKGITGTQAQKRPAFMEMLQAAQEGKFDLIVTREVCRFARNTVDTLTITRELKARNIEVYFVTDNIWTMDGDGELRLSIMATLAQEESRKISDRVKEGQMVSREKGTIYGNGNILGYDRCVIDKKSTYVINEEQAETVREIFKLYCEDEMGMTQIANYLIRKGVKNASGLVKWSASNVGRILSNRTYTGYQEYFKSVKRDFLEKRINNYDKNSYMRVASSYEPIISVETFEKAEAIRKKRTVKLTQVMYEQEKTKKIGKKPSKHFWPGVTKCNCGSSMRRDKWHVNATKEDSYGLQCYGQINHGSKTKMQKLGLDGAGFCDVKMTPEWKLEFLASHIFKQLFGSKQQKEIISQVIDILEANYVEEVASARSTEEIQRKIDKTQQKIKRLAELYVDGVYDKNEYIEKRTKLESEIESLSSHLTECEYTEEPQTGIDFEAIRKALANKLNTKNARIDVDVLKKYISRVVIHGNDSFTYYINLSGKEVDFDDDIDTSLSFVQTLTFEQAREWRKQCGDYLRNRQWNDIQVQIVLL